MSAPNLTATVDTTRARNVHVLCLNAVEVDRRTSATRRYTHVLAIESPVRGWTAWSWHLTEAAAYAAARSLQPGHSKRVIEIVEVEA